MEFESTHGGTEPEPVADFGRSIAAGPAPASTEPLIADPGEHNTVFLSLVTGDKDIVGLVAYSIYKQNKYDWLMAFNRHQGRMPSPDEVQSYLFGESTPRRLATYRHLAEATLDGRGLEVPGSAARALSKSKALAFGTAEPAAAKGNGRPVLIGLIIVVLVVIGLVWFFHGGPLPSPK